MTRRAALPRLARLVTLQRLDADAGQRAVAAAAAHTDICSELYRAASERLVASEADLAAALSGASFCLDSFRIAAAILNASEAEAEDARETLVSARRDEAERSAQWRDACHRADWLDARLKIERKAAVRAADDAAENEARSLRLALSPPAWSRSLA